MLAGYVAPRHFSQASKSEVQVAKTQIESLEKALELYRLDTRRSSNPRGIPDLPHPRNLRA
jgi:general secretion pathway protein G